jgi:FkbM family methyltransferase
MSEDASTLANPYELGGCVYYSQNREDLILQAFFPGVKKGFYVDVGAFDPDLDSVTKLFYLQGWHGINVEPQLDRHKLFQARRKRDTNLNVGVSTEETTLKLRAYESGGLSTFSSTIKHDYEQRPNEDTRSYTETTVAVRPLRSILAEQKVKHIDFLKIDVEGLEYQVIASNDWQRFRPEVLCIEANHIEKDWHPLLKKAGYKLVFDDGLNEYFADAHTSRGQKFNYIEHVVHERGGGIRADHYELLLSWFKLGVQKTHHVEELARQNDHLHATLTNREERLEVLATAQNSILATSKRLVHLILRKFGMK